MLEPLRDAADNVIPTDLCECGRPKLAGKPRCCAGCRLGQHVSGCNMRCATMGVPGFGVVATAWPAPRTLALPFSEKRAGPALSVAVRPKPRSCGSYHVAEEAGLEARRAGRPASSNPYMNPLRGGVAWHNAWRRGWERG